MRSVIVTSPSPLQSPTTFVCTMTAPAEQLAATGSPCSVVPPLGPGQSSGYVAFEVGVGIAMRQLYSMAPCGIAGVPFAPWMLAHIDWQVELGSHPDGANANELFAFWMASLTVQSGAW